MRSPELTTGSSFFGWRVVAGAFVIAIFGWGMGFYGPPIYLHAVREARGWPIGLISAAITAHYLCGAVVIANLPKLYRRFGLASITRAGTLALAIGLVGWAIAEAPWQLFCSTLLTGAGWVTLGAAAINAMVSPWFVRLRPKALSTAYNGASVGGIVFSPLWVLLIEWLGFARAAAIIGAATVVIVFWLTARVVTKTPEDLGQHADGDSGPVQAGLGSTATSTLIGSALHADWKFRTLALGMALGLFAQIGLLAHLFTLIIPALGAGWSGIVAGFSTASAIAGRTLFGWLMTEDADRRRWAAASYAVQITGILVLMASGFQSHVMILAGVLLFGFGIGNATSLPPLIAQKEFARDDVARVVPLIVAMAQATYAFAPAIFGLIREVSGDAAMPLLASAAGIKLLAIAAFLAGRHIDRQSAC